MTNEDKNKFDALEQLRAAAWDSFDKRRTYEWRICIALWTAFAAFIGAVVTGRVATTTPVAVGTTIIALAVLILHHFWLRGLSRAHETDKREDVFFRRQMMDMLGLQFSEEDKAHHKVIQDSWGKFTNWSRLFQIGVTTLLVLGTIITIWSVINNDSNSN